jgi:ABC-2 type transport system permease protein
MSVERLVGSAHAGSAHAGSAHAGSAHAGSAHAGGVIHDIGYQRYDGPRLGRSYVAWSLYSHGVRTAFGLGRGAKAKVFPWICAGIVIVVATVLIVVRSLAPQQAGTYWDFPRSISLVLILFCAVVAPELVSRDLRGGVLPLYFSRPLTRPAYALAKLASIVSAVFVLLAGAQTLMFLGAAFSLDSLDAVWDELGDYGRGLAASGVYAIAFASLALLVASLAGRRAVAAAMVVALFLITTPVYGVLMGVAYSSSPAGELTGDALALSQLAGLVSPMTLVGGVVTWWFDDAQPLGPYGPLYGAVTVGLVLVSVLLLLLRYQRVAR